MQSHSINFTLVVALEKAYNETVMHLFKRLFSYIKHHKRLMLIVLFCLLVIGFIFRPKPAPPIATQEVKLGTITQTVSVSGAVAAKKIAALTFPIGGTISWVGVKTGDTVTAGQTIATLDVRTALKNLQQSLIAYSIARNTFDQTIDNNGGTKNPSSAVNDAEKRILQNNQYNLDQAVNSVELQDLARQQSILSTPIAGIVTRADATVPGVTAIAGSTTFTIVDPTSIVFNMDVDEADIGKVIPGQIVRLTLDAYPNEILTVSVDSIDFVSHTTTNGGNAYTVMVKLTDTADNKYRVGMNGSADIITNQKHNVLTIPLASLINDNEVYVKTAKGFVVKKLILGLQSDTDTEVVSGLSAGDAIATQPTQITKK